MERECDEKTDTNSVFAFLWDGKGFCAAVVTVLVHA